MDYSETIAYLYRQLPMYHRIGAAAYKANLDNIQALSALLGHPEAQFRSVHVAGTNGKGSVTHLLASILQEAGYKTGLFTSPHLKDFRERIRINGKMIAEEEITRFVDEYKTDFDAIAPSFFEWTTALAFRYFAHERVDIAIVETGLGGRLDSTNILRPELSVITNISFDHMQFLGDTLEKIAGEKAGIIKEGVPVIVGERQAACEQVFIDTALMRAAPLLFASDHYRAEMVREGDLEKSFVIHKEGKILFDRLRCSLKGNYQSANICTALLAAEVLRKQFPLLKEQAIVSGIEHVVANTGLQGRFQVVENTPLTIADVGHNEAGIKYVVEELLQLKHEKLHIVFGLVNDKNPAPVLSLLPREADYYFCKANLPRAMDAGLLRDAAKVFHLTGEAYESVAEAYQAARRRAGDKDLIFVGGSTFVVAEVI
jgi:dihydrofolate synthase/folylpolyglutamate synthase